jgi:PAP2 superfamily
MQPESWPCRQARASRLDAEAGQVADPVVAPCPRWPDLPAQMGRRTCGPRRAQRGRRVRGAGSEPAGRGHRCGRVPPDQSLARVAVSADVDSPVVGSDRGSSPGGRRGRVREEAAPGRCPGDSDAAEGIAGVGGQDVRAAWPTRGDGTGRDLAWQGRCPRAELSLRSRHGDLCDRCSGGPYFKGWWKVLPWALAAAVCLSRVYLGAHFPLDVAAGAGLGMLIGGVLNLAFGVPSANSSSSTARANGLR